MHGWSVLPVRLVAGLILLLAGYQKLVQTGVEGVTASFVKSGIPLPDLAAPFIIGLELVGGAGILLGLFARWWGVLFAIEFAVAAFYVKLPQGWNAMRIDLLLLAAGLMLALGGAGPLSIDGATRARREPSRLDRREPLLTRP
jgi:putative oxidoreductase